ncbi:alpha/beta fold hydrolase [Novosphingobium sp. KN65.2]|uniref:alpha/beta fold hydrolase n=1 Tax=Novosphingobium sp. KN65.2 TaxID=1478134 RepID=UPI0005E1CF84|nr:alpha/beta hydrolase [Novosphingobium sp. KN65.2]CDO35241.1 putative 2-hydroxy-6-oxononadienedioate/2-hydroxy-6-oxononatrienedioate hydrolase 1 [Novosphingobium sp. KN65.2]
MLTEAATSKFVQLPSLKVHYNEAGEGEPLICCIGNGPGTSAWVVYHRVVETLSKHFRCLLLDQPGYGKSDPVVLKGESRSQMYARTLLEFMDALGIAEATIVDMSFGAQTGQLFAIRHPDRVRKLVLHAPGVRMPPIFTVGTSNAVLAMQAAFRNPSMDTMRSMMHQFLYNGAQYSDEELMLQDRLDAWLSRPELEEARRASDNVQININEELKKITAPSILIHGRDDPLMGGPEAAIVLLNYLQDSRLVILNKCGHWVPFERPDEFCRLVVDFVKYTQPLD